MNQTSSIQTFSLQQTNLILFVLIVFVPLVGMGIDLIAPSLPAISASLNLPPAFSKNLITVYGLGMALGSFVFGFLSDAWGRRNLILGGMLGFTIASLLPPLLPFPAVLLIARFLQGCTIACYAVLMRGMLSDILTAERLLQISVLTAMAWGIGPIIGPVIGGYLQYYFQWQACFYFYAAFSSIALISMLLVLPETHLQRQALSLKKIKMDFLEIISHRIFLGSVMLMGLSYSFLIVFNTLGPFLIQVGFAKTPIYFGHLAMFMGVCFLVGTMLCRFLIKKIIPEKIISRTLPAIIIAIIIFIILAFFKSNNLILIIIASNIMYFSCGIIYPAANAKGLSIFRHLAGSAASVMSLFNISFSTLVAFAMSLISVSTVISLCALYLILLILCLCVYRFLVRSDF